MAHKFMIIYEKKIVAKRDCLVIVLYRHHHLKSRAKFIYLKLSSSLPPHCLGEQTTNHLIKEYFLVVSEFTLAHKNFHQISSFFVRHQIGILNIDK
jgi:hypothetical protein